MTERDMRKIKQQLEAEMLIRSEELQMDDGRTSKCYYIDYQLFVNVVRYRIFLMKKQIIQLEKSVTEDINYQCPTCKENFSSLDAQKYSNMEFKFLCTNCCPHEDYRVAPAEPYYTLVEIRQDGAQLTIKNLAKKLDEQLNTSGSTTVFPPTSSSSGSGTLSNDSIASLLNELKDKPLIRNLPSENKKYGIVASKVTDAEIEEEIQESVGHRRVGKVTMAKVNRNQVILGHEIESSSFSVTFDDDVNGTSVRSQQKQLQDQRLNIQPGKRQTTAAPLPDFLTSSRVVTAEQLQQQQVSRIAALTGSVIGTTKEHPTPGTEVPLSNSSVSDSTQINVTTLLEGQTDSGELGNVPMISADLDDVNWEEDES
jgi:hypothetical protein